MPRPNAVRQAIGRAHDPYSAHVHSTTHGERPVERDTPVEIHRRKFTSLLLVLPSDHRLLDRGHPCACNDRRLRMAVSENKRPLRGSGGLMVVPDFSVADAAQPDSIVVPHCLQPDPASQEATALHERIRQAHRKTALTMSDCTGASQLAKTGLLDGIPRTTTQLASDNFARSSPEIDLRRGPRFVEAGRIATAGGLSAGIDLALRGVSRYFSDGVAQSSADFMEYGGTGWRV